MIRRLLRRLLIGGWSPSECLPKAFREGVERGLDTYLKDGPDA